jgi:hypothetical protein
MIMAEFIASPDIAVVSSRTVYTVAMAKFSALLPAGAEYRF